MGRLTDEKTARHEKIISANVLPLLEGEGLEYIGGEQTDGSYPKHRDWIFRAKKGTTLLETKYDTLSNSNVPLEEYANVYVSALPPECFEGGARLTNYIRKADSLRITDRAAFEKAYRSNGAPFQYGLLLADIPAILKETGATNHFTLMLKEGQGKAYLYHTQTLQQSVAAARRSKTEKIMSCLGRNYKICGTEEEWVSLCYMLSSTSSWLRESIADGWNEDGEDISAFFPRTKVASAPEPKETTWNTVTTPPPYKKRVTL